jgi:HAD superfamily hydrolase (TIGR01549 family)
MTVTGVLFDVGGTIIHNQFNPSETFQKILEHNGIQVTEKAVREALKKTEEAFSDLEMGKIQSTDFYNLWDIQVLTFLGIERYPADLISHINNQWLEVCGVELFPDVIPTIDSLKEKNIKRGVVSNAYEEEIEELFSRIELSPALFDCIVGVDTIGKPKPHPDIFHHALSLLGIPAEEVLFIGDDLQKDYYGAEKTGMCSLLLVRNGNLPERIRCITSLTSITTYLSVGNEREA